MRKRKRAFWHELYDMVAIPPDAKISDVLLAVLMVLIMGAVVAVFIYIGYIGLAAQAMPEFVILTLCTIAMGVAGMLYAWHRALYGGSTAP